MISWFMFNKKLKQFKPIILFLLQLLLNIWSIIKLLDKKNKKTPHIITKKSLNTLYIAKATIVLYMTTQW